jgi:hypothetical protein
MMSPEELRRKYPELQNFTDTELRLLERDIRITARLAVEWYIERRLGSNNIPFGLLQKEQLQEYDTDEDQ